MVFYVVPSLDEVPTDVPGALPAELDADVVPCHPRRLASIDRVDGVTLELLRYPRIRLRLARILVVLACNHKSHAAVHANERAERGVVWRGVAWRGVGVGVPGQIIFD